jgi:hydrophobic/amphiphilic exporter-1 (mainly G- bacteria), HAE1 family
MIKLSISRPVAVTMTYMTIGALGIAAWRNIPIELLPDSDLPRLTVSATLPGSSPEVMEAFVTSPMESSIQQVRGVEKITSTSTEGSASINIEFAIETDMEFARLELSERIAALEDDLPTGVRTSVQQYIPDAFQDARLPLMSYTLTGPFTQEYLRQWATETLDPELRQLEGVGNIFVNGGRDRILEVSLDENKIRSLGLSPQTVQQRVAQMEFIKEAGAVETGNGLLRTVALRERAETPDDILALPVLFDQGRVVRISDVGSVRETFEDPTQYYRIDGFPAVTFYVWRAVRSNAVATADRIKAHIAQIEHSFPSGVRVILDQDQSKDIRAQLSDLRTRAIASAVIVLLVLLLFLRSIRAAVVVFATVAFSVLITMNIMYFGGFTLNLLTLMGLAMGFGLVVDNAIVVLENTYRRRRSGDEAGEAARRGAAEVVIPILAATGTTVVVLIPFVYLQGELRIFYVPLAIVVGIALLASLFVAFTFIPSLGARLLGAIRPVMNEDDDAGRELTGSQAAIPAGLRRSIPVRLYAGLINLSLVRPWITVTLAVLALGGSYFLFNKYVTRGIKWGGGFGETKDRITINILQPRGEELERTDELARFFESRLRQMPEVEKFVSEIYADRGKIDVFFPDSLQYSAIPPAIKEQMVQYSLLYGGTDVRVYGYGPSFYGGGGGSSPNYAITVLGYNYEQVRLIAEDIGRRLERFSRIREVDTNSAGNFFQRDKVTEIVVDVDRARLALHNLTARDVVGYVGAAIAGRNRAGGATIRVGGEEMDLAVKLSDARDMDVMGLENLLIPTATAREGVRLSDVATISERRVLNRVIREDQQYQRIVSWEFRGPAKLGDRVKDSVLKATALPPGYSIKDRQLWTWSKEEQAQIWGVIAVAIVLVYMVTAAVFESIKQPFCVLLTVPMALIGVFLVFFYTGANFTREAYVGVIMMSGIVVNNAILLVDHVNQLRRREGMQLAAGLIRGSIERVRPILMTSLTTICGLLPLVLFSKSANANIWNALAYTLIGGLASSTILVLTVTPALYMIFERRAERKRLEEGRPLVRQLGDEAVAPA